MIDIISFSRLNKTIIAASTDLILSIFSITISLYFNNIIFEKSFLFYISIIFLISVVTIFVLYKSNLYLNFYRYTGINYLKIFFICIFILFLPFIIFLKFINLDNSIYIISLYLFIFSILFFISRVLIRKIIISLYLENKIKKNIIIYGAGEAGYKLIKDIDSNQFSIKGFVDDDLNKQGLRIDNFKVFNPIEINSLITKDKIDFFVLSIPSANQNDRVKIINNLAKYNIPIHSLPKLNEILNGSPINFNFKNLNLNDFIDREYFYRFDNLNVFSNKNILVTGAGGSIGSEICIQLSNLKINKLIIIDNSEYFLFSVIKKLEKLIITNKNYIKIIPILGNIQDYFFLERVFREYLPNIVIHSAAYKHVALVETNIIESIKNNFFGSINVINLSIKFKIKKFKLISTDKAVSPSSIMGSTKKLVEDYIQDLLLDNKNKDTIFSIVRFGNVFGSSGSVVELFYNQIISGGPITITHKEVTRYFISIHEAVNLVIHSLNISKGGEIYVLDMGKPYKIYDLALKMLKISGYIEKNDFNPNGNIEIKIIGLHPGEKIHEKLSTENNLTKTEYKNILIAKEKYLFSKKINEKIKKIEQNIINMNNDDLKEYILKISNEN